MLTQFLKLAQKRRSIRTFNQKKVPFKLLRQLFEAARWAPSACNQQPWLFVVVDKQKLLKQLVSCTTKKILWAPVAVFCFTNDREKRLNFDNIQSTSAAIENFLLAAAARGLGTVWLAGFSDKKSDHKKVREILKMSSGYLLQAIVLVGFPNEEPLIPQRLSVEAFLFRNQVPSKLETSSLKTPWDLRRYRRYLDKIMPVYLRRFFRIYETALFKQLMSCLPKKGLIIDSQSFYGTFQKGFPSQERGVVLTNLSFQAAEFLKEETQCQWSLQASPTKLPFRDEVADGCTLLETLNHFSSETVREAFRVLKPRGKLLMLVKRKFSLADWIYRFNSWRFANAYLQPVEYPRGPCAYFSLSEVKQLLSEFRIIRVDFSNSQRQLGGFIGRLSLFYKRFFSDYLVVVAEKMPETFSSQRETKREKRRLINMDHAAPQRSKK